MKVQAITSIQYRQRGSRRGQSLIVAVIVMFVLLFIGAVFVGLVARNLLNSGRAKDTVSATQFAEAGIKYADYFLQNSPLGADWRPAITPVASLNPNDPDLDWLASGFTRVAMNGGRALIRVTYRPDTNDRTYTAADTLDPLGKYIKIESVGRVGNLDPNDPTSFLHTPSPRLRREYVAYKQIGLTDYLRYVTNLNKDTKAEAFFGVNAGVPVFMQMGGLPFNSFYPLPAFLRWTGAPMRVNAKLHLGNNIVLALDRRNGDVVQVGDDITVDPEVTGDPTKYQARVNQLDQTNAPNQDPTVGGATKPDPIIPTDGAFNTFGGLIRDAAGIPDIFGYVRAISRLDPPVLDAEDQSTGFTRYRQLTRGSGKYLPNPNSPNNPIDLGRVGLGSGLYIDNFGDTDLDPTVSDAETLTKVWLTPGRGANWQGPYYIPPGVTIEFGYPIAPDRDANGAVIPDSFSPHPGFRVSRNAGIPNYFRDLQGQKLSTSTLDFTYFIYVPVTGPPVLKIDCEQYRQELRNAPFSYSEQDIDKILADFNGVIYAEGNMRVRGLLAGTKNIPIRRASGANNTMSDADIKAMISTSLSLVAGSNIYVEGSLIREEAKSMVALLAVQNVAVNTTMFVANASSLGFQPIEQGDYADQYGEIPTSRPYRFDFLFGEDPTQYQTQTGQNVPINMLLRHGVEPGQTTFMNLFVNAGTATAPDQFQPNAGPPAVAGTGPQPLYWFKYPDTFNFPYINYFPATYPIGLGAAQQAIRPMDPRNFENIAVTLLAGGAKNGSTTAPYVFTGDAAAPFPQGLLNSLTFGVDTSYTYGSSGSSSYRFGHAAISPMDARIEAVMYAQNGRFFIIPGLPVNPNASDSRDADIQRARNDSGMPAGALHRLDGSDALYPLAGEPQDCRITVIGAISENRTATAAEQSEWMKLWGWVPQTYGSTGHDTRNINGTANEIPKSHLFVNDNVGPSVDMRFDAERNAALGDPNVKVGISRGIRFIYDPALAMPYVNYTPTGRSFRYDLANFDPTNPQFDSNRTLPPLPRLPVCPGFVFNGEVR